MQIEYGLIPEEPGMEESYTIIPEEFKMNPNCPCPTRTCPNHGFCRYCVPHHEKINRRLVEMGLAEHAHPQFCRREEYLEEKRKAAENKEGREQR